MNLPSIFSIRKSKNNKIDLEITIKDREGMHQTEHSFDMNGVFKNSKKVHYVVKSQRYMNRPCQVDR